MWPPSGRDRPRSLAQRLEQKRVKNNNYAEHRPRYKHRERSDCTHQWRHRGAAAGHRYPGDRSSVVSAAPQFEWPSHGSPVREHTQAIDKPISPSIEKDEKEPSMARKARPSLISGATTTTKHEAQLEPWIHCFIHLQIHRTWCRGLRRAP